MASLNKVQFIGNLGKDPELKNLPTGQQVCKFSLAMSEKWKGKDGQMQEKTEWANIVVWGKLAGLCSQYLSKGRQCYVEGKFTTRSWDNKEGVKQYSTEIVAHEIKFLSPASGNNQSQPNHGFEDAPPVTQSSNEEDLPF